MQVLKSLDVFFFFFFLIISLSIFCFLNLKKNRYILNILSRFLTSLFIFLFILFLVNISFVNNTVIFSFGSSFENYFNFIKVFLLFCCLYFLIFSPSFEYNLNWEYTLLILIVFFGLFSVIFSNNLFTIFLGFELIAVCIYILIFLGPFSKKTVESGVSYFILSALLNLIFLLGISFLFIHYPSLYLVDIQLILGSELYIDYPIFFIFLLIFLSFAFKVGLVPFYNWLPVVYEGFSLNLIILLMVPIKITYFVVLIKLLEGPFISIIFFLCPLFFLMGVLSILVGLLGAVRSTSFKSLFIFASILHSGILFIFLGFFSEDTMHFIFVYLFFYGVLILVIFIFSLLLTQRLGFINISDFSSLILNNKKLSWWFFFNLFSFVGVPPLLGFLLKAPFVMAFLDHGSIFYIIFFLFFLSSGGFYYLKIVRKQKFSESIICIRLIHLNNFLNSWYIVLVSFVQLIILFFSSFIFLMFSSY